jgi:cyclomaltodextrinase / maltogenic alpha-amylase / neopullulanase
LPNEVSIRGRIAQRPTAVIISSLSDGRVVLDGRTSLPDELEKRPIQQCAWTARTDNPSGVRVRADTGEERPFDEEIKSPIVEIISPEIDGEYYFSLRVIDEAGREDKSAIYFVVEQGQARIPDYDHEHPAWVEKAIVYGVIPGKFGQPGFHAIAERLDDLADLGVTAIWLAPINVSPPGDYGYAVVDYFNLNPSYGSKEDFHRMVQQAHDKGIRVLMDFVPNHTSEHHPYYLAAQQGGPGSPYWDFYDRDANGERTYYFNWTYLPNLNYENPEVRSMMIEAFSHWVREFDVDGFRVDACWGVKQRRPDFWPLWRKELKRIKPALMLLAEASARDPYYFEQGFDVAYDWTDELGHWAWTSVWDAEKRRLLASNLTHALTNGSDGYHPDTLIFRFLNNNDTGTRFITTFGEGMTRVATALLLTLPGVPCIYTGDEIGAEFKPYENPEPLSWIEHVPGLRDYHKQLIELRSALPSLHSRLWTRLELEPARDQNAYAYVRYHDDHKDPILVLLNFSEEPTELKFPMPEEFSSLAGSQWKDLLSGEAVTLEADGAFKKLSMSPHSVRLLHVPKG